MKNIRTTIEITDSHLKILQAKDQRGKAVISHCDIKPIFDRSDSQIEQILSQIALDKNIQADNLQILIPRRLVILKQLRLPSQNDLEIKKMLNLQLVSQIPYSLEDIIFDYQIIAKEQEGYTQVLVVVVHKDVVGKFLKPFTKSQVQVGRVGFSSQGILGWVTHQEQKRKFDTKQVLVVVNVDLENTEICFFHKQKLLFSRVFNHGARELGGDHMLTLIQQIEVSLGAYKKEGMGEEVKKIIIVCELPEANALKEQIEYQLSIPSEVRSPFDNVLCQKKLNLSTLRSEVGMSVTPSLGALVSGHKLPFNLTPQELSDSKASKKRRGELIKFSLLLLMIITLLFSVIGFDVYRKNNLLKNLTEKIDKTKPLLERSKKELETVEEFEHELSRKVSVAEIVSEIYKLAPEDVSFRTISFDTKRELTFQGYAQSGAGVNSFHSKLVNSKNFEKVVLKFSTGRRIFNVDVTDFKITAFYKR